MKLMQGNEACAEGSVAAGCRFFGGYPISPSSEIAEAMARLLPKCGGVFFQAEDEMGSLGAVIGASLGGLKAMTATSGPGFSLMQEHIGYAYLAEIPCVIVDVMRGGPSTGLPTRNGQSDLLFALNTGHGEFPRMVISSGDVEECIYDAMRSLNYAHRYQLPVIHMIDKNLANTTDLLPDIDNRKVKVIQSLRTMKNEDFKRYSLDTENGISEMGFFGKNIFWMTGDEHDELGHVTEDSEIRDQMMRKRFKKLETAVAEIPLEDRVQLIGNPDAEVTFVTWGSQKGPILDVIEDLRKDDISANLLYIKMFEPFPSEYVTKVLKKAKIVIDVESNMTAQAAKVIKQNTGLSIEKSILKYNGRHMTEDEILEGTKKILEEVSSGKKIVNEVLINGA